MENEKVVWIKSQTPNGAELISWEYSNTPVDPHKQYDRRILFIYKLNNQLYRGNISAQSGGFKRTKR